MNIIDWMIQEKYAKNGFQASAIEKGLKLGGLELEEQQKRVKTYRAWRDSKVFKDTKSCFEKAIAGEEVPELKLEAEDVQA